jgi:hypothetical protein
MPPSGARRRAGACGRWRFDTLLELAADWYWETDAALRFTTMRAKAGLRMPLPVLGSTAGKPAASAPAQLAGVRRAMEARQPFDDFECTGRDPSAGCAMPT